VLPIRATSLFGDVDDLRTGHDAWCCTAVPDRVDGEDEQRQPHQRKATKPRRRERLVEDDHADDELEHRRQILK